MPAITEKCRWNEHLTAIVIQYGDGEEVLAYAPSPERAQQIADLWNARVTPPVESEERDEG
jgi:hypothetical protein